MSQNSIERHNSYPLNVWCVFLFSLTWDWFTAYGEIFWKIKWHKEVIIDSLLPQRFTQRRSKIKIANYLITKHKKYQDGSEIYSFSCELWRSLWPGLNIWPFLKFEILIKMNYVNPSIALCELLQSSIFIRMSSGGFDVESIWRSSLSPGPSIIALIDLPKCKSR